MNSIQNATQSEEMNRKIFCIGFNKTGTSSLHKTFLALGLKSIHNTEWAHLSRKKPLIQTDFKDQCYCDGSRSDFIALDKAFPGSLFIYNHREEKPWLKSRVKHVLRLNSTPEPNQAIHHPTLGWMAKDFFTNPELSITKWIAEYRIYSTQANAYFKDRKDFLPIDITKELDYGQILTEFLSNNKFKYNHKSPGELTFLENTRDESKLNQEQLIKYYCLIEKILDLHSY